MYQVEYQTDGRTEDRQIVDTLEMAISIASDWIEDAAAGVREYHNGYAPDTVVSIVKTETIMEVVI